MTDTPAKPVLLTGASGALGRVLVRSLGALGWRLVLTDIAPFPDAIPAGATFTRADLSDGLSILRLTEGCGAIIHLGGVSTERPFEDVIGPNIRGLYHIYEAARREKARVIFASSNHSVGFHERTESIPADTQFLPDGYYGLSKAYGELMGRMYWLKHGVENVNVRIGSCFPEPVNARMLATWLSYPDLSRLMERCVLAPKAGHAVIWGASNNERMTWWRDDARQSLGWTPIDSADPFAGQLADAVSDNLIEERYMGGAYCAMDYTREDPAPAACSEAAMTDGVLYIGQKRYSSWSMRGWLAVKLAALDVDIRVLNFTRPGPTRAIEELSPNGLVPFLEHNGAQVWESLAICDYCAELQPSLWPSDRMARAHARSIAAEMHAGFRELRMAMWMNLGRDFSGLGRTPGALQDVARIEAMWAETRARFGAGGPFLFGPAFGAADAMYAPVVARFLGWKPEISGETASYCAAVRFHPLVAEWYQGAAEEPVDWLVDDYERMPAV